MNPVLLNFPEAFETERLLLRCPLPGDGSVVNAAIHESVHSLSPWMVFVHPTPPTKEQTEEHLRIARAHFLSREDLTLLIFDKQSREFIGSSGLHRINWSVRRFEIGYWVRESMGGRGYVTEAVNGILQFADEHLGANRIEIRCDSRNVRSRNVAERCGFYLEGLLRNNAFDVHGTLRDDCVFAKIRMSDGRFGYPSAAE